MGERHVIRTRVDRTILGTNHAPATFGFDAAHRSHHLWAHVSHATTVGYLVKPVGRCYWANFKWLEQNIVFGVAAHGSVSYAMPFLGELMLRYHNSGALGKAP